MPTPEWGVSNAPTQPKHADDPEGSHEKIDLCVGKIVVTSPLPSPPTPLQSPRDVASAYNRLKQHLGDDGDPGLDESEIESMIKADMQVLKTWLDREVKQELRSIDRKLGELVSVARHSHSAGILKTRALLPSDGIDRHEEKYAKRRLLEEADYVAWKGEETSSTLQKHMALSDSDGHSPHNGQSVSVVGTDSFGPEEMGDGSRRSMMSGILRVNKHPALEARMIKIRETISAHQTQRGKYAAAVWRCLENRYSSLPAYVYSFLVPTVVMCSVFVSFWQTVPGCPLRGLFGEILQSCFETVFALELIARCCVCPDRGRFWRDPLNFIDLFSALPILFRIIVGILTMTSDREYAYDLLSTIALLPVLRLLKLTRRFETFQLLLSAFMIAIEALPVLLYTLIVIALVFSAIIYWFEPRDNIANLPQALWFTLVTMTTVGYGDITPRSIAGHFVTTILMLVSGLYMAIPIGIVGNAFSQAWGARDRLLLMQRLREAFLQQGFSQKALYDIVRLFDTDGDGELGFEEFNTMLETMRIHIGVERVHMLLDSLDDDGSGKISVDELMNGLFPRDYKEFFASISMQGVSRSDVYCRSASVETNHYGSSADRMERSNSNSPVGKVGSSQPGTYYSHGSDVARQISKDRLGNRGAELASKSSSPFGSKIRASSESISKRSDIIRGENSSASLAPVPATSTSSQRIVGLHATSEE